MSNHLIRIYQDLNVQEITKHLLIWGDVSAQCGNCQNVGLNLQVQKCPGCEAEFKYIAVRTIGAHFPKIKKLLNDRAEVIFVDHADYTKVLAGIKAKEFLK